MNKPFQRVAVAGEIAKICFAAYLRVRHRNKFSESRTRRLERRDIGHLNLIRLEIEGIWGSRHLKK